MADDLARVGARWDDDPSAGEWILPLLGEFGPTLGHAVPQAYAAYAVVPLPRDAEGDLDLDAVPARLDALLEVLDPWTGESPLRGTLWEGWPNLYAPGGGVASSGVAVMLAWDPDEPEPSAQELAEARREAEQELLDRLVARPLADRLRLPHREYHVWTGTSRTVTGLLDAVELPSHVWPEHRRWFLGLPIYTAEVALGGPADLVGAVLADARLEARAATPSTVLDIDD
ncbi:hypothetical protein ACH436_06085 [Isoptericola sp. NPDC019693]|uniref:hypothetical protein n=1 Tax=Isoptericola sp. NPDC019693 TaxID=3364009 RepID=UPI0037BB0B47